jgi:Ca-activated chloride channel family protein
MLPGGPSYYGLAIHARRVVFVIDISGSMQGARIAAAKRELAGAVQALPEDREFNILAYNQAVGVWQPSLVRATDANKQNATRFVAYLNATGHTATYDAIDAAFRFDVEAVYFLTDGEPTTGKFVAPRDILEAVSQGNRRRRISIYAVGVGPGAAGSPLDTFLKMLAEQNFGLYRRVDQ